MRRLIAISLTTIFSWMLIAPVFAPSAEANLPPCCRRNGKHHCMMRMMERLSGSQRGFTSVTEKCPYFPVSSCAVHAHNWEPNSEDKLFAEATSFSAGIPQALAPRATLYHPNHPKRGPPTLFA